MNFDLRLNFISSELDVAFDYIKDNIKTKKIFDPANTINKLASQAIAADK